MKFIARGKGPYRVETLKCGLALVLDSCGSNRITFPEKPGAVFFPDTETAQAACEELNGRSH